MPLRPPTVCSTPGCYAVVLGGKGKCHKHKKAVGWESDRNRGTRQQRGYGKEWYRVRDLRMGMDKGLCQPCLRKGKFTAATEVDHRVPKSQGGTDDIDNLESICRACHKAKTQAESVVGRN